MTGRLLNVCARPQREAATAEWASFRDGLGVDDADLVHHDLVRHPLPADLDRYAGVVVGGSPFNVTDVENLADVVALLRAAAAELDCGLSVRTLAGDAVDEAETAAAARRDRERKRLPTPVRVDLHATTEGVVVDAEAVLRGARARGLVRGATVDEVRRTSGR